MHLSELQKYILKATYAHGARCPRDRFMAFYKKSTEAEAKIITRSLERLITKGYLIGYGHKTAEKWFTETVSLTPVGRTVSRRLFGQQQRLPLTFRSLGKRKQVQPS